MRFVQSCVACVVLLSFHSNFLFKIKYSNTIVTVFGVAFQDSFHRSVHPSEHMITSHMVSRPPYHATAKGTLL